MNVHHPRGEAIKSTAIACLRAHWQYSFVSFNSSLTNTPVVFSSETAISLQNYPFQTGLSMLPLERNIYPNFRQELGNKSGEEGTGTNASIETLTIRTKEISRCRTNTHAHNLPLDRLLPLGRGRCFRIPPARARRARVFLLDGTRQGARPCGVPAPRGFHCGTYAAPASPSVLNGTHERPRAAAQGPPAPVSCPPKAAQRSGDGELWGHPRPLACRRPKPAAGGERAGSRAGLFPFRNAKYSLGEVRGGHGHRGAGPLRHRAQ